MTDIITMRKIICEKCGKGYTNIGNKNRHLKGNKCKPEDIIKYQKLISIPKEPDFTPIIENTFTPINISINEVKEEELPDMEEMKLAFEKQKLINEEQQRIAEEKIKEDIERQRIEDEKILAEKIELQRITEEKRLAEENERQRIAEEKRIADEKERHRIMEQNRLAEEKRVAEEKERQRIAEEKRIAEEQKRIRVREEKRLAEEKERQRIAEQKRLVEEQNLKKLEAIQKQKLQEEQEKQRILKEQEEKRRQLIKEQEKERVKKVVDKNLKTKIEKYKLEMKNQEEDIENLLNYYMEEVKELDIQQNTNIVKLQNEITYYKGQLESGDITGNDYHYIRFCLQSAMETKDKETESYKYKRQRLVKLYNETMYDKSNHLFMKGKLLDLSRIIGNDLDNIEKNNSFQDAMLYFNMLFKKNKSKGNNRTAKNRSYKNLKGDEESKEISVNEKITDRRKKLLLVRARLQQQNLKNCSKIQKPKIEIDLNNVYDEIKADKEINITINANRKHNRTLKSEPFRRIKMNV